MAEEKVLFYIMVLILLQFWNHPANTLIIPFSLFGSTSSKDNPDSLSRLTNVSSFVLATFLRFCRRARSRSRFERAAASTIAGRAYTPLDRFDEFRNPGRLQVEAHVIFRGINSKRCEWPCNISGGHTATMRTLRCLPREIFMAVSVNYIDYISLHPGPVIGEFLVWTLDIGFDIVRRVRQQFSSFARKNITLYST